MKTRQALRQTIRNKRRELTEAQQNSAALALLKRFCENDKILSAKHIAIYLSNDGELNTQLIIDWCWHQGKQVYLPVVHPFSKGHLLFLHFDQQTELVNNQYGIAEPKLDVRKIIPAKQLDIICTPLVAFDKTGVRLGMGGGFYDRTLSQWHQQNTKKNAMQSIMANNKSNTKTPYPIGLAHDCQLVDSIPTEVWDIPLPEIITPSKQYEFN